ncbi:MAG: branched-chain amino acid transport system substrate-binding protein [Verrucomicrobiales bacterium]|jgi:branched-chain amino acid transport system substrate-binding protein
MVKIIRKLVLLTAVLALFASACSSDSDTATGDADTATTAAPDADTGGDDEDTATTAAPDTGDGVSGDGEPTTLKIGVLLPLTGFVAGPGEDAQQGLQLYFDEFGDGKTIEASGVTIEFVLEDTGSDAAVALTAATKLVEVDKVDIIVPGILASTGAALGDALGDRTDVLQLSPYSCTDDFTQRTPLVGYARPGGWACSQSSHAFGVWAFDEAGYTNIATSCADYSFGYEHCGGFADAFTNAGGTISEQIWFPPPNQDFGTYATQMNGLDVDAIFGLSVGGAAVPFITAYSDFGVNQKTPLLAGAVTTDQSVLRAMDEDTVLGTLSHGHWAEGADIPATQDFVKKFEDATGKIASYYAAANYSAMQWIVATLEETGGVYDPATFIETMKGDLTVDTPFGTQSLDEYGSPVLNIYIREVQKREDGKLWNVPIFTYEGIDQFFPYTAEEFLSQPTYTKDFQGNGVSG